MIILSLQTATKKKWMLNKKKNSFPGTPEEFSKVEYVNFIMVEWFYFRKTNGYTMIICFQEELWVDTQILLLQSRRELSGHQRLPSWDEIGSKEYLF